MDREKAIDKIQKLLAISQGSNYQHEAESALAKAQRLMLEHNIALAEVEATVVGGDDWVTEDAWTGGRRPWESDFVENIVQEFFFCRVIHSTFFSGDRSVQFFGDRENVAVARYVYVFLCRTFRDLWLQHKRKTRVSQRECRTYYAGLYGGFRGKLRSERHQLKIEQASSGNALIRISNRLEDAFKSAYPSLRSASGPSPLRGGLSSFHAGLRDGKQINLRTPIGNEEKSQRKLTHVG